MPAEDVQELCLCGWPPDWHEPGMREVAEAFANLERAEDRYRQWMNRRPLVEAALAELDKGIDNK